MITYYHCTNKLTQLIQSSRYQGTYKSSCDFNSTVKISALKNRKTQYFRNVMHNNSANEFNLSYFSPFLPLFDLLNALYFQGRTYFL